MSGAEGVKKPNESQKARALWKMKAAKYDPERNSTGTVKRAPQSPDCGTGQSFEVRGEFVQSWIFVPRPVVEMVFNGLWPRGLRHGSRDAEKAFVGKGVAPLGSVGQRAFAHSIHALERSREVWAAWRAPFLSFEERADGP